MARIGAPGQARVTVFCATFDRGIFVRGHFLAGVIFDDIFF
jgi:hypothetical protein